MEGLTYRRACMECRAPLSEEEPPTCPKGHSVEDGWYVTLGASVVGLGHPHYSGFLAEGGVDLAGYRMAGAIKAPTFVVDLDGKVWVAFGLVRRRDGKHRALLMQEGGDCVPTYVTFATPVRPLPERASRARFLNAMMRAAREGAA